MSKTVATSVLLVSVNHISEDEEEQLLDSHGVNSLDKVALDMEGQLETILARRVFGDADEMPILDVSTEVYEDWSEDDAAKQINQ